MAEAMNDQRAMEKAVACVRNFLRDKPLLNRLLRGKPESDDSEIRQCIVETLMDWNRTPPPLQGATLRNHPNKALLVEGAALRVLTSAGIWHSREHMPSNDGGTSADDHAKAGEYSAWVERLTQDYERKKSDLKMSLNVSAALNHMGSASEYANYELLDGGAYW
jgi:hypothetical protein